MLKYIFMVDLMEMVEYIEASDINEMLKMSITIADTEIVFKIILHVFKFKKQICEQLLRSSEYYENLHNKLLSNLNYQIKFSLDCIITTLYLFSYNNNKYCEESEDEMGTKIKKELICRENFLKRLTVLFLITNEKSLYWNSLCICLRELILKYEQAQEYCSFILPVCLVNLNESEAVVLNLTMALIQNNVRNKEKIVDLGGLQKIRHLIKNNIGIELLYHVLTDCPTAVKQFNDEKMYEDIEEIIQKSPEITNEWKWSKLIFEKFKDVDHCQEIIPFFDSINCYNNLATPLNILEKEFKTFNNYKNLNVMRFYSKKITRETSNIMSNKFIYPQFTKENEPQNGSSKLIVNIENKEKTTDKVKKIFNSVFNCEKQTKNFHTPNIQYTISSVMRNNNETEIHLKPFKPIPVQNKFKTILKNPSSNTSINRTVKNDLTVENVPNFKNTLKKLKFGVTLYGTNFRKIRDKLWKPEDCVTPAYLYDLYKMYILKK